MSFSSDNVTPLIHERLCHPLKKIFNCCDLFAIEKNTFFVRAEPCGTRHEASDVSLPANDLSDGLSGTEVNPVRTGWYDSVRQCFDQIAAPRSQFPAPRGGFTVESQVHTFMVSF